MNQVVWWREVAGGGMSALVGLPSLLACALIVAGPLDHAFFPLAVQSALVSALGGTLIGSWLAGIRGHISGPRISMSLLIAAELALHPGVTPATFLGVLGAATILTGLVQVLMGALRLGSLVRYLPFPVLAGFLTAVNLGVIWSQAPLLLAGLVPIHGTRPDLPQPMSVLTIAVTVAVGVVAMRWLPRIPYSLPGVLAGCVVFYLTGLALDPHFTYVNQAFAQLSIAGNPLQVFGMQDLPLTRQMVPHALALAILASLETLLSASAAHKLTGAPLQANRELIGQGVVNMAVGLVGGMPVAGSPLRTEVAYRMGARTRASAAFDGLFNLGLALFGAKLLGMMPTAVISGSLIGTTLVSLRIWGVNPVWRMLKSLKGGSGRHGLLGDFATLTLVLAVGLVFGLAAGVGFGVLSAMALFIMKSGASVMQSTTTLVTRRSTLQRSAAAREILAAHGNEVRIVELRGALFFGSSDFFAREAKLNLPARGVLIIDLEHVNDIDSSGAAALFDVARAGRGTFCQVWLVGALTLERHRAVLSASGVFDLVARNQVIDTVDHALERAENGLLDESTGSATRHVGVPLARAGLFSGFNAQELAMVRIFLEERVLARGETLFEKGDPVDGLYIIDEGQISVRIEDANGVARRIAAFTPGTMIGEIAFIEGGTRSALVMAEEESRLWLLRREKIADLQNLDRDIVHRLMANVAREIASRLRNTTDVLRQR